MGQGLNVGKVAKELHEGGTGHETLKLILEDGDAPREFEDHRALIEFLEAKNMGVTADKVRVINNQKPKHQRDDSPERNTDALLEKHSGKKPAKE